MKKKWKYREAKFEQAEALARDLEISVITAVLLCQRGFTEAERARKFLFPSLQDLSDPLSLTGMKEALGRINLALERQEKMLVYGDYDVDGITSSALLYSLLKELGGKAAFYIPSRFAEGYGLHKEAVQKAAAEGYRLLITVDCGEKAEAEIILARELGLDIIITDHHQPQGEIKALAHINPWREKGCHPGRHLAGVGIAYKLAQAMLAARNREKEAANYLDLVALGTIADIAPLLEENRILVKHGLEKLQAGERTGMRALLEAAGYAGKPVDAGSISFGLAPRLNAAGRMGDASPGVELLTTSDLKRAREIAAGLDKENKLRQKVEQEILAEASALINAKDLQDRHILVLASHGWHEGVLGIVASRLSESFHRPVILLSLDGKGMAKGSGRSVPGFNLAATLTGSAGLLERFGGHELAAGLTIKEANIDLLADELNLLAQQTTAAGEETGTLLDILLDVKDLTLNLAEELSLLAPFGQSNPQPVFGGCFQITGKKKVGKNGKHLKLTVEDQGIKFPALFFGNGSYDRKPLYRRQVELAFAPEVNIWDGKKELSLIVKGMSFSDIYEEKALAVVDRRHMINKRRYLQELVALGEGNITVYVNTGSEKELLAKNIAGDRVAFLHQGKGAPPEFKGRGGHLVLWSLPFQQEKLKDLIAFLQCQQQGLELHLIFGANDYKRNSVLLGASIPRQEVFQELFAGFRQGRLKDPHSLTEISAYLQGKVPYPLTDFLLQRSLEIICDLCTKGEQFAAAGNEEKDFLGLVKNHPTFRADTMVLAEYEAFQKYLLTAEAEELVKTFCLEP